MNKIAYAFDPISGEYTVEVDCQPSPREPGKYLQPANTLLESPPTVAANEAACAVDGVWVIKPDFRGQVFYMPDGSPAEIYEIGILPAADWTTTAPILPEPPIRVSPWQFRKTLNASGLRQQVEDAIAASTDQDLKDGWEFATEFIRTDPLVVSMGQALGKTDADMDALFELAQTL